MKIPVTATIYLERDLAEIEVLLDSFYLPAEPDVYNLPNGDPGYPGHPEEIEIISAVNVATGEVLELTLGEREKAEEAIKGGGERMKTTAELQARMTDLQTEFPDEIKIRVDDHRELIEEVLRLRAVIQEHIDDLDELSKTLEE